MTLQSTLKKLSPSQSQKLGSKPLQAPYISLPKPVLRRAKKKHLIALCISTWISKSFVLKRKGSETMTQKSIRVAMMMMKMTRTVVKIQTKQKTRRRTGWRCK